MKKKKILKILGIAAVVVIVLVGVGIAVLWSNINTIARKGIIEAMEYVLQVDVKLEAVDIKVTSGEVKLTKLVIGNPKGFNTDYAFSVDEVDVKADIKSFTKGEPHIYLISITEPHAILEQGFRSSNLKTLSNNAARFSKGEEVSEEKAEAETNIIIDKIIVDKTKVSVSAPVLKGNKATVTLPKIEIDDYGKKKMTVAEAISSFFSKLLSEAVKSAGDIIPEDVANTLKGGAEALSGIATSAGDSANQAAGAVEDTAKDAVNAVGDTAKDAVNGITGLLGGKKKEDQ